MALSSCNIAIAKVHRVQLMTAHSVPGDRLPSDKPTNLVCDSVYSTLTIAVYYYYLTRKLTII